MLIFNQQFGHELAQPPDLRVKHIHLLFQAGCLGTGWNRHLDMAKPFTGAHIEAETTTLAQYPTKSVRFRINSCHGSSLAPKCHKVFQKCQ